MIKWILASSIILCGIGAIILGIQLKDYKYPSQIQKEIIKEFNKEWEQLTMTEWIDRLTELSKEYNFKLTDVPDILEEYILIDNEVIEQKNIENLIKEAYNNERTHIGKNTLKQLLEAIQWVK